MRSGNKQSGFTLIEIMVVVVIVATVLSIATLSFNLLGNDRELRTEGQRLAALLEVTHDEAAMQGREFGVEFMTAGYRFVEFDAFNGQWSDVLNDDILRLRGLPDDVEFELFIEDKRILLDDDPAAFEDPEETTGLPNREVYSPHVLVYSSGETTPFELHFWRRHDQRRLVIRGDALGAVEFVNGDQL